MSSDVKYPRVSPPPPEITDTYRSHSGGGISVEEGLDAQEHARKAEALPGTGNCSAASRSQRYFRRSCLSLLLSLQRL